MIMICICDIYMCFYTGNMVTWYIYYRLSALFFKYFCLLPFCNFLLPKFVKILHFFIFPFINEGVLEGQFLKIW